MSDAEYCKCGRRITHEISKQLKAGISCRSCRKRFNLNISASWDYPSPENIQTITGTETQEDIDRPTKGPNSDPDQIARVEQVEPRLVTPDPNNLDTRGSTTEPEHNDMWEPEEFQRRTEEASILKYRIKKDRC